MHFYIMTLFPEMVMQGLDTSIIGRAMSKGILSVEAVNIRDYAFNKHNSVDDYPYGGGAGMLMQAEPVYQAYEAVMNRISSGESDPMPGDTAGSRRKQPRVVYLSPQGKTFHQGMAEELAKEEELIFLCGHYEGIDERVLEEIVTDYVSIGDYVVTGGELPAMIMVDAISRLVPGVLHNDVSAEFESFQDNLLEYPQYSRPEIWHGKQVPEVLLSGHHANVEKWRREQSVIRTARLRPDLLEKADLSERERETAEREREKAERETAEREKTERERETAEREREKAEREIAEREREREKAERERETVERETAERERKTAKRDSRKGD